MKLSSLKPTKGLKKSKRIGRGESSGKGKTSGRGMKGQKARTSIKPEFDGGQLPIIKRLPFKRGVGNRLAKKSATITLSQLNKFDSSSKIDLEFLRKNGLLPKGKTSGAKVVATGEITKPLTIALPVTKKAKELIEKVKGKVEADA